PGRARLYGSELRCVAGEPWNRVEGAVSMGSSSNIFRMADTSIGYAMSYPSGRNIILIVATLPFIVWRIEEEEAHLSADPEYRRYMDRVRYRLWPGVV